MIPYSKRLGSLAPERSLIAQAESRAVILTGQSSFTSSRLTPSQCCFLESVAPPDFDLMRSGFPYHADLLGVGPAPSLTAASWRNAAQTLWSTAPAAFHRSLAQILGKLLARTSRRLVLITGSCGLQFANSVWSELHKPAQLDIRVIALGPACFGPVRMPGAQVAVVQGSQDYWSKLLFRGRIDFPVQCGHLDYWNSPEVCEIARAWIAR
jgi:hypothetical protein